MTSVTKFRNISKDDRSLNPQARVSFCPKPYLQGVFAVDLKTSQGAVVSAAPGSRAWGLTAVCTRTSLLT